MYSTAAINYVFAKTRNNMLLNKSLFPSRYVDVIQCARGRDRRWRDGLTEENCHSDSYRCICPFSCDCFHFAFVSVCL